MKNIAFTLAEVLITLGIIGIVAAMTMPALIGKYQEAALKSQFKKVYSLLFQSLRQMDVNNGGVALQCYLWPQSKSSGGLPCLAYDESGNCKQWASGSATHYGYDDDCDIFQREFEHTIKIIKVCENNALKNGCIPEYSGVDTIQKQNNEDMSDKDVNKATAGVAWWRKSAIEKDRKAYVLSDGTILLMSGWSGMRMFAVDVNGMKKPNKWGYDLFVLSVVSDNGSSLNLIPSYNVNPVEKGGKTAKQMLTE